MAELLIDEHPQNYQPTLATWIGLNEAIFLQQLHYIIVKNDSVGKFVDGRKWYRDKPRDFAVKYFPFWDEGTVKRTIANLRADGLLLARSDLNKDPKDHSLWYTPHHEAINRLSGPVDRILGKSEKRKEARQARKPKDDSDDAYTKVQNVLLINQPEIAAKVQIVPHSESTNCTEAKVQIVPTPKELQPKDSISPNGDSGQKPPPPVGSGRNAPLAIPAFKVFIEVTSYWKVTQYWRKRMGEVVGEKPDRLSFWRQVVEAYTGKGWFAGDVKTMLEEYFLKGILPGQDRKNGTYQSPVAVANKSSPPVNSDDYQRMVEQDKAQIFNPLAP